MLSVEAIFLGQLDTVAFNLFHGANMLAVSVDDFHMLADIHSLSPWSTMGVRTLVVPEDCQKNDDWDWNAQ
jgi:hypothetical protein